MSNSQLTRDAMNCKVVKQVASSFWDTTVEDQYVRNDGAPANDFNNSIENDGQDWFVGVKDENRADDDHLCEAPSAADKTAGHQCSKIRCVARRRQLNEDPNDM